MSAPPITPADVPALRRELADWHAGPYGAEHYTTMIRFGRQVVRPAGPAHVVGPMLSLAEARRLADGELWYLDQGMCDLIQAATPTMPRFAPVPQDLPSETGFAVFARPLTGRDPMGDEAVTDFLAAAGRTASEATRRLAEQPIEIGAVSWGPLAPDPARAPAGGAWLSFWAHQRLDRVVDDPETLRRVRAVSAPMTVDNEAAIPWCPPGDDPDRWLLPATTDQATTWGWAAMTLAAFRLASQDNLAASATQRTARPERRRTQRTGLPERDVRVIRLRRGEASDRGPTGEAGREYHHRWVVRGHWRNQPWGPGRQLRRPAWILPHVKGPDGAPLLGGEKVTVVGAPPADEGEREA